MELDDLYFGLAGLAFVIYAWAEQRGLERWFPWWSERYRGKNRWVLTMSSIENLRIGSLWQFNRSAG